jgi:hypothetical protein
VEPGLEFLIPELGVNHYPFLINRNVFPFYHLSKILIQTHLYFS